MRATPRASSGRVLEWAVIGGGGALALLLARDGAPMWRLVLPLLALGATGALLAAMGSGGPDRRGLLAFAAGAVGLAAGVGLAVPHLTKVGLDATGALGVVHAAAGTVLVTGSAVVLVRRRRSWRRVVAVVVLLVLLGLTLRVVGPAVAATNVPRTPVGSTTPADRGLEYLDVRFPAADGVTLDGWYVPSSTGAAVVLLHGAGSTRSGVLDQAVVLARHGYGVLLYDARGHGESGGRAMDFGWAGDDDVAGAVAFLVRRDDVDPDRIAAVGSSMGGEQAIGAAAADPRITAVVAEGATTRVAGDEAWLSEAYGWRGVLQEGVTWATFALTDLLTSADRPATLRASVAAAAPRPVLLIAAGDLPDERHAARHIRSGSPGTVDVWVVPGAGHTDGLDVAPREWERRVTTFLDRSLDGTA